MTPALATVRLDLEPLRIEHAAEMVGVLSDPALGAYTGDEPPTLDVLVSRYARQSLGHSSDGVETWHNWVLRERATGAAAGFVQATVTSVRGRSVTELAWVVGTPWQGRGLATEGALAVLAFVTTIPGVEVVANIAPGHAASEGVARRLGLRQTDIVVDGELHWTSADA